MELEQCTALFGNVQFSKKKGSNFLNKLSSRKQKDLYASSGFSRAFNIFLMEFFVFMT